MSQTQDFLDQYGPWALVTGASSGIGEQFAHVLAERGFNLIVTARRTERLETLAQQLRKEQNVEVEVLPLDLGSMDFIDTLNSACNDKEIGLIISNAGFGLKGQHHLTDPQQMSNMLNVNSRAPMLIAHALTPKMIERGKGGFLMTGSIEGFLGFPWSASYAATKAFVKSLGESLWFELKPHGIDVMVLSPGSTDTEALSLQGFDAKEMSGVMTPRQVAELALSQLGKKQHYVAGLMNRLLIGFMAALPRRWGVAMAGSAMRSAVEK